jgi:hypothetical protein
MKSQHQQFHMDQTQQTFDLSKQVMVLDERILEVQNAITATQEEYKVHRKNILAQEEKIKEIQEQITNCQVQIEILRGKPGDEGTVGDSIRSISLMEGIDDFIPTAQNSPRWESAGGEEEISRLGHQVDLTSTVRQSRPSELLDLASCHLESLLPPEDVERISKLLSPSKAMKEFADHSEVIALTLQKTDAGDHHEGADDRPPSRPPSSMSSPSKGSEVHRDSRGQRGNATNLASS